MGKNIFEQIRDGESPAEIVFKNEYVTAFQDLYPNAPVHILLIPNKMIPSLSQLHEEDAIYISHIYIAAKQIAHHYKIDESGYRVITNNGNDGGQEIPYLHFHLVGGLPLGPMIRLPKSSKKILKDFQIYQMMNKPIATNMENILNYDDFVQSKHIQKIDTVPYADMKKVRNTVDSMMQCRPEVDIIIARQLRSINHTMMTSNNMIVLFPSMWCHPDAIANIEFHKGKYDDEDIKITYVINNHEYEPDQIDTLLYTCTGGTGFLKLKIETTLPHFCFDIHYTAHYMNESCRRYLTNHMQGVCTGKTKYVYNVFSLLEDDTVDTTYKSWYLEGSTQQWLQNAIERK